MAGEHRFHTVLKERVDERLSKLAAELAIGSAKDYGDYRQSVGYAIAMNDLMKLCEEIEREFDER